MRFFLGDENGQLKSVVCTKSQEKDELWKIAVSILDDGGKQGKSRAVQRLAAKHDKIALAREDGSTALFEASVETVRMVQEWRETRFKQGHQYVGIDMTDNAVMSCTSAGHLRLMRASEPQNNAGPPSITTLPNRLSDWILSEDTKSFVLGGNEVEVSLWDASRAFDSCRQLLPGSAVGSKRTDRKPELIDGEIWRAKNVPNDSLNLRQPVHNTSLAFISRSGAGASQHILAGTRLGSVRRYDTRAARKPVADWKDLGKVGGIRKVQRGSSEHEAFVADNGSNLFALDLRTGRVLYTYNGIAGSISALVTTTASHPPLLASTSLDRFFRLHSIYQPPEKSSASTGQKGDVLAKVWVKSAADCVVWDGVIKETEQGPEFEGDKDDIWAEMKAVGQNESDYEEPGRKSKRHRVL